MLTLLILWISENPDAPRREQAFSADSGAHWETHWVMDFSMQV
ncbi:hypothetical protein [Undibacterium sp. Ren11W]